MKALLFPALWLATSLTQATLVPSNFPFSRPLSAPATAHSEIGAVVPDGEWYAAVDDQMANVRLFDTSNGETPFLVRRKVPVRTVDQWVPFPAPLTIQSLREQPDNRLELIVTRDPQLPRPAALEFASNVRNFEKLVTVEGSRDGEHWTELAREKPLYDYSRYADVRRHRIPLADGDDTTYRIKISNITEKKDSPLVEIIRQTRGQQASNEIEATSFRKEPFRIDRLTFLERRQRVDTGAGETEDFAVGTWSVAQDARMKETLITFTVQREPLCALTLLTDEANFSRQAVLEGRASEAPETWRPVATDRLSRIRIGKFQEEHLVMVLPAEPRYRTYRLTLHNQDNPPLTVKGLRVRRTLHEILFFPKSGQSYRLCWGGEDVAVPQYDVGSVLAGVPAGSADLWSQGTVERAPGQVTGRSWACYSKKAMVWALVVMVGILLAVVFRMAGKIEFT